MPRTTKSSREAALSRFGGPLGKPRIVWYDAGHISALRYLMEGIIEVTNFFQPAQ